MTQPTPIALADVPRYVKDAVRAAGGAWKDVADNAEQSARVARHLAAVKDTTIQDGHAGLRGKALGTWILDGAGLDAQIEQGRAAAATSGGGDSGTDGKPEGTASKPKRTRGTYADDIHDLVTRAKAIRGYGPGPKQHAHMAQVVAAVLAGTLGAGDDEVLGKAIEAAQKKADNGKATPAALIALGGAKAAADLHAMGAKEKPLTPEVKRLGKLMGDDAWCKGGHLAAHLAATIDQLNAAKRGK